MGQCRAHIRELYSLAREFRQMGGQVVLAVGKWGVLVLNALGNLSFWFSYILFLIFLGGILVLFIYVTSLASNEMFKPSIVYILTIIMISSIGTLFLFLDPIILMQNTLIKIRSFIKAFFCSRDIELISTIYRRSNMNLTIFIVFYLLLTLIVVVKVTGNFFGPLRLSVN